MLSDRVESVIEAEKRVSLKIDQAKTESEKSLLECEKTCSKIISDSIEQADIVSKGLYAKNDEEIAHVFKGADVIAEDRINSMENMASTQKVIAVKKIIEMIREY